MGEYGVKSGLKTQRPQRLPSVHRGKSGGKDYFLKHKLCSVAEHGLRVGFNAPKDWDKQGTRRSHGVRGEGMVPSRSKEK